MSRNSKKEAARASRKLTDKCLLTEVLGLLEVLLPLEQGQSLVDEGKNVDPHGLAQLLHLNRLVKLLNGLGVVLLVKEQLAVVVVHVRDLLEVLHRAAEGGHRRSDGAHLVLSHTKLDMGVDEGPVEVDGLLVVLGGLGEFTKDEVQLGAVVVDVGIVLVVGNGQLKVIGGSVLVACRERERERGKCPD